MHPPCVARGSAALRYLHASHSPACSRRPLRVRPLRSILRLYATRSQSTPASASLLAGTLDQKQRATRDNTDSVGPFQLGIPPQSLRVGEKVKKWSELSSGEKVIRSTKQTTNFTVIVLGAGLAGLLAYTLSTELFAKNSPTVLYGQACDRIRASPQVAKYLHGSLIFHNTAPSLVRPRHHNRQVPSVIAVDSSGKEHLMLHFYVEARPKGSVSPASSESFVDRAAAWTESKWEYVSHFNLNEASEWIKERFNGAVETSKRAFRYLSGDSPSTAPIVRTPPPRDSQIGKNVETGGWGFAGVFSGLRKSLKGNSRSDDDVAMGENVWIDGEVHADLVKNSEGQFVFRYLMVDIPNSRVAKPIRVFVERNETFREGEAVVSWEHT